MKIIVLVIFILFCFPANSDEGMDGIYYCTEQNLTGISGNTGKVTKFLIRKFILKLKKSTIELRGDGDFPALKFGSDPRDTVNINTKNKWLYADSWAIFNTFKLEDSKFTLLTSSNEEYLISTGTCLKW